MYWILTIWLYWPATLDGAAAYGTDLTFEVPTVLTCSQAALMIAKKREALIIDVECFKAIDL